MHNALAENRMYRGLLGRPRDSADANGSSRPVSQRSFLARHWGWCLLLALGIFQYCLFRQHALREVVWAYPPHHDQLGYLTPAYELYEAMKEGIGPALWHDVTKPNATGILLTPQAALAFMILGPERLSALTLNFAWFFAFQLALAGTLRWLTGRWSAALIGVGLLLTAATPFYASGGVMDYRMDFTAFCLMGLVLCAVIRSHVFLDRRWSAVVGVVAAVLVLFRFITAVYLAGIFGIAFMIVLWRVWRGHEPAAARMCGMLLAGGILCLLTWPVLYAQRHAIKGYYIDNHVTGEEKQVRAAEQGIYSTADALLYYPRSVLRDHLGSTMRWLGVAVLAGAAGIGIHLMLRRRASGQQESPAPPLGLAAILVGLAVLVPLSVLTADISKSQVVANILVPGILWLVLLAFVAALRASPGRFSIWIGRSLAVLALVAGTTAQARQLHRHTEMTQHREDIEHLLAMYDRLGEHCHERNWQTPRTFVCSNNDYLNHLSAELLVYERQKRLIRFGSIFAGVFRKSDADVRQALEASEIVLFEDKHHGPAWNGGEAFYEFDKMMQEMRPLVRNYCESNLHPLGVYPIFGRNVIPYVRPTLKLSGLTTDAWITNAGADLCGKSHDLRGCKCIELTCETNPYLKQAPSVTAELRVRGQDPVSLPARIVCQADAWCMQIDCSQVAAAGDESLTIHLSLDTYFVPRALGINSDERQLTVRVKAADANSQQPHQLKLVQGKN